jgi:stage II sporulation protein D
MSALIRMLLLPTALTASLAASGWLRGSIYDGLFDASDLLPPPVVGIGLGEFQEVPALELQVNGPVRILDASGREPLWRGPGLRGKVEAVAAPGPGLRIGERLRIPAEEILVVPARDGTLRVGRERYRGALRLRVVQDQRALVAVNEVDLEHYLQGVIASEMRAEWPIEALKAQAVAARSFALHEVRNGYSRRTRGFDLYDDDRSQAYRGMRNECPAAALAVRATYGQTCRFGDRLLKAFYMNTCGGRTEAAAAVFQEQDIPPLAGRDCEHCVGSKYYRWRVEIAKTALAAKVFGPKISGSVASVRVVEKSANGLALKVSVKTLGRGGTEKVMTGKDFRAAVGAAKFKSSAFDVVEDTGDRIVFEGRGWGHLVGLCQEGARGYADRVPGASYQEILSYYYPGISLSRTY